MAHNRKSHSKFHNVTFAVVIVLLIPALYLYHICRMHPELFNDKHGLSLVSGPLLGFEVCPQRNFEKIKFTGDSLQDNKNFILANKKLKELVFTRDTINGVCFEFGNKSNYASFIKAIDMCYADRPSLFVVNDFNIWALNTATSDSIVFCQALEKEFGVKMSCE